MKKQEQDFERDILEEIFWKPIPEYEGFYEVSNYGIVKSLHKRSTGNELKTRLDRAGYYTVRLIKNNKTITRYVHRLTALLFIPNLNHKPEVNHKNGTKTDNQLSNLEWVTHSENIIHAYNIGLCNRKSISKKVIDMCSGKKYDSIKDASTDIGISYSTCKNYLSGRRFNRTCLEFAA